jgi:hypothetical protein
MDIEFDNKNRHLDVRVSPREPKEAILMRELIKDLRPNEYGVIPHLAVEGTDDGCSPMLRIYQSFDGNNKFGIVVNPEHFEGNGTGAAPLNLSAEILEQIRLGVEIPVTPPPCNFVDVSDKIKAVDMAGNPIDGEFEYVKAILSKNTAQLFLSLKFVNYEGLEGGEDSYGKRAIFFDISEIGIMGKPSYFYQILGSASLQYFFPGGVYIFNNPDFIKEGKMDSLFVGYRSFKIYMIPTDNNYINVGSAVNTIIQLIPESIN